MARKKTRKNRWLSNKQPLTEKEIIGVADNEIFLSAFNPDYYQIMKRISDALTGLRNGSAPGTVGL